LDHHAKLRHEARASNVVAVLFAWVSRVVTHELASLRIAMIKAIKVPSSLDPCIHTPYLIK
jgi:hypothetical protein